MTTKTLTGQPPDSGRPAACADPLRALLRRRLGVPHHGPENSAALGQRHRQPAPGPGRQSVRQRLHLDRQLTARGDHALAAGPGRGLLRQVPLPAGRRFRPGVVAVARAGVGAERELRLPPRPRLHHVRERDDGIAARWTLFVHAADTVELWRVELSNLTDRPRRLEICAYLEWNCGVAPSPRREFTKLFLENEFDPSRRAVFARNHMWEVPSQRVRALEHRLPVRRRARLHG